MSSHRSLKEIVLDSEQNKLKKENKMVEDINKQIAELEAKLAELKKKQTSNLEEISSKEIFDGEDWDICVYKTMTEKCWHFKSFNDLFKFLEKRMKKNWIFSISTHFKSKEFKDFSVETRKEILNLFDYISCSEMVTAEICLANTKNEIEYEVYFHTPILYNYSKLLNGQVSSELNRKKYYNDAQGWSLIKEIKEKFIF